MTIASAGYSITMRLYVAPDDQTAVGRITTVVGEAGGVVTDADGGEDWLRGGHIVAAGAGLHGAIRERVVH